MQCEQRMSSSSSKISKLSFAFFREAAQVQKSLKQLNINLNKVENHLENTRSLISLRSSKKDLENSYDGAQDALNSEMKNILEHKMELKKKIKEANRHLQV